MSVIITKDDLIAYAEVDYIIKHMNERYREMVPENLLNFFETIKDPDYNVYIDPHKPLQSQGLKKYTLQIIALLHVKYWCKNKERREELVDKMRKNQEIFEQKLREQFSTDKLFNNNSNNVETEENDDPIVTVYGNYVIRSSGNQEIIENESENNSNVEIQKVDEKISIISKIKNFISRIFKKI